MKTQQNKRYKYRTVRAQSGLIHHVIPIIAFIILFGAIGTYVFFFAHAATSGTPELLSGITGGYCLNDPGDDLNSGSELNTALCNGSTDQQFQVAGTKIELGTANCLSPLGRATTIGTTVVLDHCHNYVAQNWSQNSSGQFINTNSGNCLSATGGIAGALLSIQSCNSHKAQKWTIGTYGSGGGGGGSGFTAYYQNPMRGASYVNERIDQGVDFGGTGPVYALGNGEMEGSTTSAGWPGGVFLRYELTSGPLQGLYVYVAEDCTPKVSLTNGTQVTANTVLCDMYGGSDGIETGFSQAPSDGWIAMAYTEYKGLIDGYPTNFGVLFSQVLQAIGAPGGNISQSTGGGSTILSTTPIPSSWDSWVSLL